MMKTFFVLAAVAGFAIDARAQSTVAAESPADSSAIYSGAYSSTSAESIFSPCDVPGIGSGWSLRFRNARDGAFLRYQYGGRGMPALSHFIRVRGRVSGPGHYGLGFQTREIVVDSVLSVDEKLQTCSSYEDLPEAWNAIQSSGAPIIGAAFTGDMRTAVLLDREGFMNVWDVRRSTLVKQFLVGDRGNLRGVVQVELEFAPDGKLLAMGGIDGVVRVWNPLTGERLWAYPSIDTTQGTQNGQPRMGTSEGLQFNPKGTLLANMVAGHVAIWSTVTGKRVGTFKDGWRSEKLLFLGDSSFIASGDSGLMKIFPRLGAAPVWRIRSPVQQFYAMVRSPDGRWLVVKGPGDTAYVWSLTDGQPSKMLVMPSWYGRDALAFSPDGTTIATEGGATSLYVRNIKTGQPIRSFRGYRNNVFKAWFTADGKSIVSWGWGDTILRVVHLEPTVSAAVQTDYEPESLWPARVPGNSLGSIRGFVRDEGHKAIVGADVWIFDGDHPGSAPIGQTTTNAAGSFLLQRIKVPHVTVRAAKRGYETGETYIHLPAQAAEADFELKSER